jgi:hypothetical protein
MVLGQLALRVGAISGGSTTHQYRLMQNVISPLHFNKAGFQQEFA